MSGSIHEKHSIIIGGIIIMCDCMTASVPYVYCVGVVLINEND